MKRSYRLLPLLCLGLGCALVPDIRAQEAAGEGAGDDKRVQYQLVLPEEKTPENVKPEEHNPFESESEAQNRMAPGDTEENRVRDRLLKLPVVGTKRMPDGRMRVLLGNIILETGKTVPPVLPEQMVELRVKNITTEYIELAWQEKRATGLPPKLMIIPINISPRVRYQMLGQPEEESSKGTNATMEMPLRSLLAEPAAAAPAQAPASTPPSGTPGDPAPPRAQVVMEEPPPPPALPVPEETIEAAAPPVKNPQSEPAPKVELAARPASEPEQARQPKPLPPTQPAPEAKQAQEPKLLATQPTPEIPDAAAEEAATPPSMGAPPATGSASAATAGPSGTTPASSSSHSPGVESVVRMLFGGSPNGGNPAPASK